MFFLGLGRRGYFLGELFFVLRLRNSGAPSVLFASSPLLLISRWSRSDNLCLNSCLFCFPPFPPGFFEFERDFPLLSLFSHLSYTHYTHSLAHSHTISLTVHAQAGAVNARMSRTLSVCRKCASLLCGQGRTFAICVTAQSAS